MSFYSYKNANADTSPGNVCGNILNGLNKRVCIQVKNVYDSCLQQEQLDDEQVVIRNVVPVLPSSCRAGTRTNCNCSCVDNECTCSCNSCANPISHSEAVENAANSPCPLPQPCGSWTFESCRSSTIKGNISNLSIERLCDRPQFARVRCNVDVPIDILFTDQNCQEWMGQSNITVSKDVLLCIPEESVIPFTLESLVSAICVSGSYIGNCTFEITICVSVVLKIRAFTLHNIGGCTDDKANFCERENRNHIICVRAQKQHRVYWYTLYSQKQYTSSLCWLTLHRMACLFDSCSRAADRGATAYKRRNFRCLVQCNKTAATAPQ